jgi:uncharacterized protein YyaL (SSP411 family)
LAVFAPWYLAGLAEEPRYLELARAVLGPVQPMLARYPLGFAQWLIALDYMLSHPREVAIVGGSGAADTQELLDVCAVGYRPHQVLALGEPGAGPVAVPLLQNRDPIDGHGTPYGCIDSVCRPPITDPQALLALIE